MSTPSHFLVHSRRTDGWQPLRSFRMDAGGWWDDLLTEEIRQALAGTLQLPGRGGLKAKWMPIMGRVQNTSGG